jgi:alginate O-acetyltransferase complex protein AlgI
VLFNSFPFLIFFAVVSALFFALPHRFRWALLLLASCVFYMFFIPVYILILGATIAVDFYAGKWIEDAVDARRKKLCLLMSILSVCGILFVFKYFNFFNENAASIARALGWNYPIQALRIILPIGLSFHTFQSLSYVIEVYRGKQQAERHFGIYALYVMYFPQLVAGPIERPQNLLHQFHEEKRFDLVAARDGLSLALWGLFKKVVVADGLAVYVNAVYANSAHHTGATLLLATYFFAFKIYCDFSGYSDIARGVSRVYGVDLMKNFETPYFATSISEFWSRWHISLSTWFKDYVYIPLGGSRVPLVRNFLNLFFVFMLSGLWHGANWTFVVWGALHGGYLVVERLLRLRRERGAFAFLDRLPEPVRRAAAWTVTFHLVLVAWVFFRADHVGAAFDVVRRMAVPRGAVFFDPILVQGFLGIAAVVGLDLFNRKVDYWNNLGRFPVAFRYAYALLLLGSIALLGVDGGAQFIYYQF